MISCKCLNFTATSAQLQRSSSGSTGGPGGGGNNINNNNSSTANAANEEASLLSKMSKTFVKKFPRDFFFYNNFMDFFKHAHGPIPDLTVHAIRLRDLIYRTTLDVDDQSWQLSICVNCKMVLCAKRLIAGAGATPTHYLINSMLLCSNEELEQRRTHKSYSETFEILIMDHDDTGALSSPEAITTTGVVNSASSLSIGSLSTQAPLDGRQQRQRQLQKQKQVRIQAEINETTERVERFAEQSFALLKSFREKSDQEEAILLRIQQLLPDQAIELLDRAMPVALEVTPGGGGDISFGPLGPARRRNTISSRRELGVPTTPTPTPTQLVQPPIFPNLLQDSQQPQQQQPMAQLPSASIITTRKMSNFDTPPATPEATPMSVGNSPTFRQQQQATAAAANNPLLLSTAAAATTAADDADDCLFDLEDVDGPNQTQHGGVGGQAMPNFSRTFYQQLQQQQYQRQQSQPNPLHSHQQDHQQQQQQEQHDNMSDADEAEDALDLDSSLSIPMQAGAGARGTSSQMLFANFARSLPVEIVNSPMVERANMNININNNNNNNNHLLLDDDEVIDNTVDIAANIKALAKSVHGEAVFGDLPRPRLRSQI